MDFKGIIIYTGAIIAGNFNEILQGLGLTANLIYIGYQLIHFHKNKNNNK